MNKKLLFSIYLCSFSCILFAQNLGVNSDGSNPDSSAMLDVKSINKGMLMPRMSLLQRNAIISPASGLMIYQTDNIAGFYYYDASAWVPVAGNLNTNNLWSTNGNIGTNPSTNFIGTTDNQPLIFKVNNTKVGRFESNANSNLFLGIAAGWNSNPGSFNVGVGESALWQTTTGERNTAIGGAALAYNVTGNSNTASGVNSLVNNNSGSGNTANGVQALLSNTIGNSNTSTGAYSLANNISGNENTANGTQALFSNTTGTRNTALGFLSLSGNITGGNNTALGYMSNVATEELSNATAIGANSRVGCSNCLVLGSVTGFNGADNSRVGIGTITPDASAVLDLTSTDKGLLIPRMTHTQRDAVSSPSTGLMIYQTDNTPGFYFYNGSAWATVGGNANNLWSTTGNTGTNAATSFIGTTDNQPLVFKINNQSAGFLRADGNLAFGLNALISNTTGTSNTATGAYSLEFNTTSYGNTANGFKSLWKNTGGYANTASGNEALSNNTTGFVNAAFGSTALNNNTDGYFNSALGVSALFSNTNGYANTAVGNGALSNNTTGFANTVVGNNANVSSGDLQNATAIGNNAIVNASNKVRIGNGAVTVIEGQVPFTTPSDGRYKYNIKDNVKGLDFVLKLRPVTYQFDTKRLDVEMNASGVFNISYQQDGAYKEASAIRRTGFIAQEVEKAAIETGYNFSGIITPKTSKDHYSLSYESFVVPLVKAVQEQQIQIQELKKENEELKKLKEQVEKLTKTIQELSAKK